MKNILAPFAGACAIYLVLSVEQYLGFRIKLSAWTIPAAYVIGFLVGLYAAKLEKRSKNR
jgi:hypothetical protein